MKVIEKQKKYIQKVTKYKRKLYIQNTKQNIYTEEN